VPLTPPLARAKNFIDTKRVDNLGTAMRVSCTSLRLLEFYSIFPTSFGCTLRLVPFVFFALSVSFCGICIELELSVGKFAKTA
jgi:hypothetical protein